MYDYDDLATIEDPVPATSEQRDLPDEAAEHALDTNHISSLAAIPDTGTWLHERGTVGGVMIARAPAKSRRG